MTATGVVCQGVWKQFRRGEHHDSLRDLLPALFRRKAATNGAKAGDRTFWAVRDVSFEVRPGEALGIIGANGAGKSTLLKLLTRILKPSHGSIQVKGRQGALIEVAAGFHPDLTGRENVFLQGAIMGMPLADITRKFDQIVDFSGVTAFIDTPVKRYSSGMNARLGFAIAAHLDPEVLFIDEVLSVGDLGFQQKAFGRIQDLVKTGIPVVVVSHQLERVASLCTHAILMDHGRVARQGTPAECIAEYLNPEREGFVAAAEDSPAIIERVTLESEGLVPSGNVARMRVHGRVLAGGVPEYIDPVVFMLQNAATGALVSAVGTSGCNVTLPEGEFVLDVDLQMNVPRGIYVAQVLVWNRRTDKALGAGPSITLQVGDGSPFVGTVQLNAKMAIGGGR